MAALALSARMRFTLMAAAFAAAPLANATDSYDGVQLRIPMVDVSGTVYTNVVTTISLPDVVSVDGGVPRGNFDSYAVDTGRLFIPAVVYEGTTYSNVTVNVALANVTHVGGVLTSPSFLLVTNPNDQTIRSYAYGVHSTSPVAAAVGIVSDPAMASADLNKESRMFLDKPNGLLFNQVRQSNGSMTVTTFSINLATGSLGTLPGASASFPVKEGTVDTTNHRLIAPNSTGVTIYPYNTVTGVIQAATASSSSPVYQSIFAFDQQDDLLFSADGTQLASYAFPVGSAQPVPLARIASSIDNSSTTADVNAWLDVPRQLLFVSDTSAANSATVLTGVPYSASTLGPASYPVASGSSSFCGIDPGASLLFVAPHNGPPSLNLYSYTANATINPSPVPFSPTFVGANYGGCAEVDPTNHIVFFTSNNPGAVSFYVYDTTSGSVDITGIPAGSISATGGLGQLGVLTTQSLAR